MKKWHRLLAELSGQPCAQGVGGLIEFGPSEAVVHGEEGEDRPVSPECRLAHGLQ